MLPLSSLVRQFDRFLKSERSMMAVFVWLALPMTLLDRG